MKWPFFAGLGIGAAIGLMYAPRSGEVLRNVLRSSAHDTWEGARSGISGSHEEQQRERGYERETGTENRREERNEGSNQQRGVPSDLMTILNEWPQERLMEIHGIGPVLASKIVKNRPYGSEEELVESKELPPSAIEALRKAS